MEEGWKFESLKVESMKAESMKALPKNGPYNIYYYYKHHFWAVLSCFPLSCFPLSSFQATNPPPLSNPDVRADEPDNGKQESTALKWCL